MELFGTFQCGSCGEINETSVDISAGDTQSYVEDCQVCCRPNILMIHIFESDEETWDVSISAELES